MNAKHIIKKRTCFKSLSNPSCIDLVITNSSSIFQNTKAISTGLSGFHTMVVSILKHTFHRSTLKELVYRDYKNVDRVIFKRELEDKLNQQINEYKHFEQIFLEILNIHVPIKRNYSDLTMFLFMTKALRKVIMKGSELESKYVKNQTRET